MKSTIAAGLLMFSAPFLLLAALYTTLPAEMPVLRFPMATLVAPKSVFTVFRIPLMNLTHGLMAAVMLSHAAEFHDERRRASYFGLFSTLLFALAFKSNFEALEISSLTLPLGPFRRWATAGTVASLVGGLALAFVRGRNVPIPWTELRLSARDKIMLVGLFALYLAIVAASLLASQKV